MIGSLIAELWPYIAGAFALGAAAFGLYRKGRGDANAKHRAEESKRYIETRKRIDDVEDLGDDPAVARDWLRERSKR